MITLKEDQEKIFNEIKQNFEEEVNVLLSAPTGWGKTFLCTKVMEHLYKQDKKRYVIIEPTVVLVQEVSGRFAKAFQEEGMEHIKVGYFYGSMKTPKKVELSVPFPSKKDDQYRKTESYCGTRQQTYYLTTESMLEFDVIVLSGALIHSGMENQKLDLSCISLIVFDEVHHCTGSHVYNKIIDLINEISTDKRPQLLGLSASIVKSKTEANAKENLENIKIKFRAVILYIDSNHSNVDEIHIKCELTQPQQTFANFLMNTAKYILQDKVYEDIPPLEDLADVKFGYQLAERRGEILGKEGNQRGPIWTLFRLHLCALENFYFGSTAANELLKRSLPDFWELLALESNDDKGGKLEKLFSVLKEFSEKETEGKLIIFEKERWLVMRLEEELKKLDLIKDKVMVYTLLGLGETSSNGYEKYRKIAHHSDMKISRIDFDNNFSRNEQKEAIEEFAKHSTKKKILISTSVGEEGLDINVSNVIYLGEHPNGQSLIQSRGRIRSSTGKYIIIDYNNDRYVRAKFQEKNLKAALSSSNLNVFNPNNNNNNNNINNSPLPTSASPVPSSNYDNNISSRVRQKLEMLLVKSKQSLSASNAKAIMNELCQIFHAKMKTDFDVYIPPADFVATVMVDDFQSFCSPTKGSASTKKQAEANATLHFLQLILHPQQFLPPSSPSLPSLPRSPQSPQSFQSPQSPQSSQLQQSQTPVLSPNPQVFNINVSRMNVIYSQVPTKESPVPKFPIPLANLLPFPVQRGNNSNNK